jgi:hypothetical protein
MDANQPATNLSVAMSGFGSVTVDNAIGFLPEELVLISNPFSTTIPVTADIFQTTSVTGPVLGLGGTYGTISHTSYGIGPPSSVVAKARFVRYFIDNTTDPAHPTLMVDRMAGLPPQPVADDIEDVQLSYHLDTNNDGIADLWRNDLLGGTVLTVPSEISKIRQVRLQFIARTRLPEAGWSDTRPGIGNRAAGTTPDGYRRRIYDIVIDVRNSGV